ncbi:ABC transporter substrate-binding protein [Saccharopolyspora sp. 5N708]|uniref:ABC transporter substrate-binding protein n=1 Tax=Saccharopolyspora sp. 5N708 TaxID=3457424 RepID=UPI003FD4F11A
MRYPSPLLALLLTVGLAVTGCSSGAADGPPATAGSTNGTNAYATYANLTGPDRTAKLLEAAKAEGGEVDVYTSNTDIQDLIDGFQRTYPDIKVNAFRANSETVLQRILQESGARKVANDVVDTNEFELRVLSKEGALAPYDGPAKQNLRPDAIFGDWQAERFNGFVVGWNTSLVPEGQSPKSFTDLADPKWRGKVALEVGDWDWYATMHTYLTDQKGMRPEAVDQLFRQVVANSKVTKGHTVQGELLSAGQFAVAASIYTHTVDKAAANGAPVAWHPVSDPVILRPDGLALMAQPRHPAAALLWADWVLSEGQKVIAESHRIPAAENVAGFDNPIPEGTPVYEMPDSALQKADMWNKAYDDLLRGAPQAR